MIEPKIDLDENIIRIRIETLRSQRDFFRSIEMLAAADHCEQTAIGWEGSLLDLHREQEMACAWAEYRKDYGVNPNDLTAAHKAFTAGWKAAREGDQSGVLR